MRLSGPLNEHVAAELRRIVQERRGGADGFSQRELARRIGCSSAHVTHLLSGRSPMTLDWLGKICEALPADPARLLGVRLKRRSAFDVYGSQDAILHEELQRLLKRGFRGSALEYLGSCRQALRRIELMCRLLRCAAKADGVELRRLSEPPRTLCSTPAEACGPEWLRFASPGLEVRLLRPKHDQAERLARLFLQCIAAGGGID